MITHDEVRKQVSSMPSKYSVGGKVNLFQYVDQQEKKDKLLELYQEFNKQLIKKIKEIEEELK